MSANFAIPAMSAIEKEEPTPNEDCVQAAEINSAVRSAETKTDVVAADETAAPADTPVKKTGRTAKAKAVAATPKEEPAAMETAVTETVAEPAVQKASIELDVNVVPVQFSDYITKLAAVAKSRSAQFQAAQAEVDGYSSKKAALKHQASDTLNTVFMFKGVSVSSEAGDVILGEKLKVKSKGSALLARQQVSDELETLVATDLLEIASGVGSSDRVVGAKRVEEGRADLARLVGDQHAQKAVEAISTLPSAYSPGPELTVKDTRARFQEAIKLAVSRDPIAYEVKGEVHRYNTHSTAVLAAHRIARVTLSVIGFTPNFAGPAAQAALGVYVVMSGGSEQNKVMKELYMGQRLQTRANALAEQLHLAFENYKVGSLSKNLPLMQCSEQVMTRVIDAQTAEKLLHSEKFDSSDFATAASEDKDSVVVTVSNAPSSTK